MALDFRTFLENMKMSSLLSKILETGMNVFKNISQIMKNIIKYQLNTNGSKNDQYDLIRIKLIILRSEFNVATFRICMEATLFDKSRL